MKKKLLHNPASKPILAQRRRQWWANIGTQHWSNAVCSLAQYWAIALVQCWLNMGSQAWPNVVVYWENVGPMTCQALI